MESRQRAAALLLSLVLTAPVAAQEPATGRGEHRVIEGPSHAPARQSRTSYLPLQGSGAGFSISSSPVIEEDGSTVYRKTLIGSLPVARDVILGLGLIEVTRTSRKERPLNRVRPMRDTEGRSDHIAAIGLSISF